MTKIYIYGLYDPRTEQLRYIGKTGDLKQRLRNHLYHAKKGDDRTYKGNWIRKMLAENMEPVIKYLAETDEDNWQAEERKWIAENKDKCRLTNITAGGDGIDAPRTPEWCKRIGDAHRGKKVSAEVVEKVRRAILAKRAKVCKRGHEYTEENTLIIKRENGNSYRSCRTCQNFLQKRSRHKKGLKGRKKSHCKNGHPLSGDNLRLLERHGYVEHVCRECVRQRNRKAKPVTRQRFLNGERKVIHKLDSHCKHGHEYNEENTGTHKEGWRYCKACAKEKARERRAKQKGDSK